MARDPSNFSKQNSRRTKKNGGRGLGSVDPGGWGVGGGRRSGLWLPKGAAPIGATTALAVGPLVRRFGAVNVMVFSHLPSNLLLVLAPGSRPTQDVDPGTARRGRNAGTGILASGDVLRLRKVRFPRWTTHAAVRRGCWWRVPSGFQTLDAAERGVSHATPLVSLPCPRPTIA